MEKRIKKLKDEFEKRFGAGGKMRIFSAPGRVNLIGEHTDYNGGFVLPVNIDRNILLCARKREDRTLNLHSLNYPHKVNCSLDNLKHRKEDDWANYPKGMAKILQDESHLLRGMDFLYEGNIPIASGLSSSAAIEVVTCLTLCTLSNIEIERKKIALLCQKAENEFMGMKCGIMDQFIITMGKEGSALFLDCRSLDYELVPFDDKDVSIIVGNTKVKRKLVGSEYNQRRRQCEEGVKTLKQSLNGIKQLRDVSVEQFEKYRNKLPDVIAKRCKHIIYENERVKKSVDAIKNNRFAEFGLLMIDSHNSLRDLYEVSCHELDIMVEEALKVKGTLSSRMTGAGFGGCTVSLVKEEVREEFISRVSREYQRRTQIKPEFYLCKIEDGAKEING